MSNLYTVTSESGVSKTSRILKGNRNFLSLLAMAAFLLMGNAASAQLGATLFVDQNVSCNGGNDGIIRLTASGGPIPYSYAWSDGATSDQSTVDGTVAADGSVFSLFGSTRTGVFAGVYGVTVTDNASGTATALSVTVSEPALLTISATGTDPLCSGGTDGSISTTVSGGTGPYSYAWSGGAAGANPSGLSAGVYSVTVTDANSCTATTAAVTLTAPAAIVAGGAVVTDQSEPCVNDGSITITVGGGTGGYTFLWNNGATTQNLSGLSVGFYDVDITDANGCTILFIPVAVNSPAAISISLVNPITNVLCAGDASGAIDVTASGGVGVPSYLWSNGAVTASIAGLTAGDYTVTVTVGSCTATDTYTVTEPAGAFSATVDNANTIDIACAPTSSTNVVTNGDFTNGFVNWTVQPGSGYETVSAGRGGYAFTDGTQSLGRISISVAVPTGGPVTLTWDDEYNLPDAGAGQERYNVTIRDLGNTVLPGGDVYSDNNAGGVARGVTSNTFDMTPFAGQTVQIWFRANQNTGNFIAGSFFFVDNVEVSIPNFTASSTGTAAISATGGTSPYMYTWSDGVTASNSLASYTRSSLIAGTYSVTVMDNSGACPPTILGYTFTQPSALTSLVTITDGTCPGDNGVITVSVSGGTAPYQWGGPGLGIMNLSTPPYTATMSVAAGQYQVQVQDANGCGPVTTPVTVLAPDAITDVSDVQNVSCFGAGDGSVAVTISGGTMPYTYVWASSSTAFADPGTPDLGGALEAGSYDLTVTDANSCTAFFSYTVLEPTEVMVSGVSTDITCFGFANGSIDVTVTDGTSPYTYAWSSSNTAFVDPGTADLNGLMAGVYTISVTDNNACTGAGVASFTIVEPAALSGFASAASNVTCNGGNDGAIDVVVSGGTPPYSYAWSNGASTEDLSGLVAGIYNVVITDDFGCTLPLAINVTQPDPITYMGGATDISCFGANDGSINITISGGTPGYTYLWDNGLSAGTSHSGLTAGTYNLTVTDANACTENFSYTVVEPAQVLVTVTQNMPLCPGDFGSATASVSGGVAPFTYLWSTGGIAATETGLLAAGSPYGVTVTDANGCVGTGSISITDPTPVVVTATGTDISCFGAADGSAIASASGGTGPYTYNWLQSTGGESWTFNAVSGAPTASQEAQLNWSSFTGASNNLILSDDQVSPAIPLGFDVNFFGSTYSTLYVSSNGFITFDIPSSSGCCSGYTLPGNVAGAGLNSYIGFGHADIDPGNGTGTITYEIQGSAPNRTFILEFNKVPYFLNVPEHTAQVILYENSSTIDMNLATIDPNNNEPTLTQGISDGVEFVTPAGRNAADWNVGGSILFSASGANVSGLSEGVYSIIVSDANGCSTVGTVSIAEPAQLTVMVSSVTDAPCFGGVGTVALDVNGGTQFVGAPGEPANPDGYPYIYMWSNPGIVDHIANGVPAGNYTVSVTDRNGCMATTTVSVGEPAELVASSDWSFNGCAGGSDGSITVSWTGGTAAYDVNIDGMVAAGVTSPYVAPNMAAGAYGITVTDANGCTSVTGVTITQPGPLTIAGATIKNSCNPGADGMVTLSVSGGNGAYTYMWSDGQMTNPAVGLAAGSYTVTVDDANGCGPVVMTYNITQPAAPLEVANFNRTDVTCAGGMDGEIDNGGTTGGTPPYSYAWSNGGTTPDISGISAGNYSVTVTDAVGCTVVYLNIIINEPAPIVVANDAANNLDLDCNGDTDGFISVTASGGTGSLSYAWSNGVNGQSISGMSGGVYTVNVSDANGCVESFSYTVTEPAAITAVSASTPALCAGGQGGIVVTISGGTADYTYMWSNGMSGVSTGVVALNAGSGSYTLNVTDANGCAYTNTYTISAPPALSVSGTVTNVSCNSTASNATNNGSISVAVSGGTSPYTYSWSNGATTSSVSGLGAGQTLTATVTDGNGCSVQGTYTVGQPAAVSVVENIVNNVTCAKGTAGEIHITASGGTGALSYSWTGPNGAVAGTTDLLNLVSGSYDLVVTDASGCTYNFNYFVADGSDPATVVVTTTNISCNGANDGIILVDINSGTGPYVFTASNGYSTMVMGTPASVTVSGLAGGTYTFSVIDQNGCPAAGGSATIVEPTKLVSNVVSSTDASCFGLADGSFVVSANAGTLPYTIAWSNGTSTGNGSVSGVTYNWPLVGVATQARVTASGLVAGTYDVTITDANGCIENEQVVIGQPTDLSITFTGKDDIDCYGDTTGSAVAMVTGGSGVFSYQWWAGAYPAVTAPLAGQSGMVVNGMANAVNLGVGFYTIQVNDLIGGCTSYAVFEETGPAPIVVDLLHDASVTCNGGSDATADVTISGGTAPYAWVVSGATSASGSIATDGGTNSFTGLGAGVYYVDVTDAKGCSIPQASFTITEPTGLTVVTAADSIRCNGGFNATASVTSVSGGIAPYTYLWSNGATTTSTGVNVDGRPLFAGSYTVAVTDATGLCATTVTVNVYEPMPVSGTTVVSNATCSSLCDGEINLTPTGGTAPYTYYWYAGATTPGTDFSNDQDPDGLCPGVYTVRINDKYGCEGFVSVTVTAPTGLSVVSARTNVLCKGDATGAISLTVSGGTAPYTYAWTNGASTEDLSGLTAGTYGVVITDANGCSVSGNYLVTQPFSVLEASPIAFTNISCFGGNDGTADIYVVGGTLPYSYLWSNGSMVQDPQNLSAGINSVTITDNNGCEFFLSITLTEPTQLVSGVVSTTNITCSGVNTGAINISVSGGTPSYSYLWSSDNSLFSATTQDLTGIAAGTYGVTITDSEGCSNEITGIVIGDVSGLSAVASVSNVDCFGSSTGSVAVTVSGGTMPYTYLWNNGATTATIDNLVSGGSYTAVITDGNGCSVTSNTVTITGPGAGLSAAVLSIQDVYTCFGDNTGFIDIFVTGGTTPYSFNWSNGATTQNALDLFAGGYQVTITDANGCQTFIKGVVVDQPTQLLATVVKATNVDCNGASTGSIDLNPNGGTAPYTINWSNGANTQDLSNLTAGTYSVTVTDANGCEALNSVTITEPAPLAISIDATSNVSCNSGANGMIMSTITGGSMPYTIAWSDGVSGIEDRTNLPAGVYIVNVTDGCGVQVSASTTITEPGALTATTVATDVDCFGANNGGVDVTVTGGTMPYQYNWGGGITSEDRINVAPGTYTVIITDANGCSTTASAIVNGPSAPISVSASVTNVLCFGDLTGAIDITVAGGTAPYSFSWSNGDNTEDLSNVAAGSYTGVVTDAAGCTFSATVTVAGPASALAASAVTTNVLCNGASTGMIDLTVTGGTAPYTYSWSNGAQTQDLMNVPAGSYTGTVTDANGCTISATITITEPATGISVSGAVVTNVSCNGANDGAVDITVTGGTAPYSYSWSNGAISQDLSNVPAGIYSGVITDANGCSFTASVTVGQPAAMSASNVVTNVNCFGDATGTVNLTVTGGTAPYTYAWSNGAATEDLLNVVAGSYNVVVTDANGCTVSSSATVTQNGAIATSIVQNNVNCFGGTDGSASLNVSGGTPPYTIAWNTGANTQNINNLGAGTYSVVVTDANGCTGTNSVVISEPAELLVTASSVQNSQQATATATGGTAPYNYIWNSVPAQFTQTAVGLMSGTYSVQVTDANGCTAVTSVLVEGVGIEEPNFAQNISLYPNPTSNVVNLGYNFTTEMSLEVSVVNSLGQVVMTASEPHALDGKLRMDVSELANGVYYVVISNGSQSDNRRLVIQK